MAIAAELTRVHFPFDSHAGFCNQAEYRGWIQSESRRSTIDNGVKLRFHGVPAGENQQMYNIHEV